MKKDNVGVLRLPDFKVYCNATVHKSVWQYRQTHRPRNRIESTETHPHIHGQMIFEKGARPFSGERTVFSQTVY